MNKEQIIDEAYELYLNETKIYHYPYFLILLKEEFINKCKTDSKFSETWGLKIEERELSCERRYNIWFNNNYETGMEKHFDPNKLPDFDNEYYEPTPTKLITITYNNKTIESYE